MINNTLFNNTPVDSCPVIYDSFTQKFFTMKDSSVYEIAQEAEQFTAAEVVRIREIIDWFQKEHRPEELL